MRIRATSLIAVCLTLLVCAGQASAAGAPGAVKIRVEGASTTLIRATTVTTTAAPIDKSGQSCSGTSAGGALQAVDPTWSGTVHPSFGQQLDVVKGESHTFAGGTYYAIYLNGTASNFGICTTELQPGDEVLIYAACAGATSGCTSGNPLVASGPATAAPGAPFTVSVTESTTTFNPDWTSSTMSGPSAGATVAGDGLSAQTGADGKATLSTDTRGPLDLLVTKPDQVRQHVTVCVTDGADGFCGTTKPGTAASTTSTTPCATTGSDGLCGSRDTTAPIAAIRGLREQAMFRRGNGPTTLAGTVPADPAGLRDVRLRITRRVGPKCSYYDGELERLVTSKACGVAGGAYFSIGDRADWSYLFPFVLPRGRYVIDVQTVDKSGNTSTRILRGRNQIVFTVK